MQSNIEKSAVVVSATEPTTSEKVWIQKGKNLLDLNRVETRTQNGLTWTPDLENDCITVTGTSTGYSAIPLMQAFKPKENFVISLNGKASDATNVTTQVNLYKDGVSTDLGSIYSLDISEYNFDWCTISLKRKSNVATNTNVKVQIEYGSQVTSYEKHVQEKIFVKNDKDKFDEFIKVEDTGWIPLTVSENVTNFAWMPLAYRKVGKTVFIHGGFTLDASVSKDIAQLPSDCLPRRWIQECCLYNSGTTILNISIGTSGLISLLSTNRTDLTEFQVTINTSFVTD